jgi:hypothetical protein
VSLVALEQCPQCAYDLVGLPETGQCPECGFEYDAASLIVLYGWNGVGPGQLSPGEFRFIWWALYALVGVVSGIVAQVYGVRARVLSLGLMTAILVPWVVRSYLRRRTYSDPQAWKTLGQTNWSQPAQLRLSPAGYGLRAAHGPCRMKPWSNRAYLHIELVEGSTYRAQITNTAKRESLTLTEARMDFDCDLPTVQRILERVAQWRLARSPHTSNRTTL